MSVKLNAPTTHKQTHTLKSILLSNNCSHSVPMPQMFISKCFPACWGFHSKASISLNPCFGEIVLFVFGLSMLAFHTTDTIKACIIILFRGSTERSELFNGTVDSTLSYYFCVEATTAQVLRRTASIGYFFSFTIE